MRISLLQNTAVTKQWTTKWPYMLFSDLYKIMVNKVTFVGFSGTIFPSWIRPCALVRARFSTLHHWCPFLFNFIKEHSRKSRKRMFSAMRKRDQNDVIRFFFWENKTLVQIVFTQMHNNGENDCIHCKSQAINSIFINKRCGNNIKAFFCLWTNFPSPWQFAAKFKYCLMY